MSYKYLYNLFTISFLFFVSSLANIASASVHPDDAKWTAQFPRVVIMNINGVDRMLMREYANPEMDCPDVVKSPLEYVTAKQTGIANDVSTTYEIKFSPEHGAWFRDGKQMNLTDYSIFDEGMRYIWTTDLRLLSCVGGNHATINNGCYDLCAGTMHFGPDGLICSITNGTGHMCSQYVQLLHMVTDLHRKGAISPHCRIATYDGKRLTPSDLAEYAPLSDCDNLCRIKSSPDIEAAHKQFFQTSEHARGSTHGHSGLISLAHKVLDVLWHDSLESRANGGPAGIPELRDENKLKELKSSRPHDDLYDKILKIRDHSGALAWQRAKVDRGGQAMHESHEPVSEEKKRAAYIELQRMIHERPFREIYDALLGEPSMPPHEIKHN